MRQLPQRGPWFFSCLSSLEGERAVEGGQGDDLLGGHNALLDLRERLSRLRNRLDLEPSDEVDESADRLD